MERESRGKADCRLLLDRDTERQRSGDEDEKRMRQHKEKTNQAPRVVEGIVRSLFGGLQCVAGGLAIIGVFGADFVGKDGGWENAHARKELVT